MSYYHCEAFTDPFMELALSWDLVVMILFVVIMAYSFIVGQNGTIKIILSSYIAMLAANGLGNLIAKYILMSEPVVKVLATSPEENIVLFKIFVFLTITVILVLKGSFHVDMSKYFGLPVRILSTTIFGVLSAGLIMSTILVFVASTAVDGILVQDITEAIYIPYQSVMVQYLVTYYNFWFAAPAIAFVGLSVLSPDIPLMPINLDDEV